MKFKITSSFIKKGAIVTTLIIVSAFFIRATYIQVNPPVADTITKDDEPFNFFVIGDWGRNGQMNQQEVADVMGREAVSADPEFIVSTGDNFYCCGVASVDDPQWQSSFENVYNNHSLQIDWYVVLGNHDYHGNAQAEVDYTKKSRRWNMPSRYYTFAREIDDTTSIRFVFVDTNPFIKKYRKHADEYLGILEQDTDKQLKWIDSVLQNSKEKWKVVVGHHPVYSTGEKHGSQPEMIEHLLPLMEKHNVQVYFAGHEHDLQHQKPANSKVNFIVSGAGSETRTTGKNEMTRFSRAVPGFTFVQTYPNKMVVKMIDTAGTEIYKTEIPVK